MEGYTNTDIIPPYLGTFGLSLFVFLSGYSININNKRFTNHKDFFRFYKKRIKRIYPLYILAILIFFVLYQIVGQSMQYDLSWWIIQLSGLEILLSPQYTTPILTLWFIGMILLFYLIYPFLLFKSIKTKDILLKSFLFFLLLLIIRIFFNIIDIRFFVYYFIFIAGILASREDVFYAKKYQNLITVVTISFLVILTIQILTGSYSIYDGPSTIGELIYLSINSTIELLIILDLLMLMFVLSITYLTTYFIRNFKHQSKEVIIKFAMFGAFSSYAVYLFHRPYFTVIYYSMTIININYLFNGLIIYIICIPPLFILSYYIQKWTDFLIT